MAIDLDSIPRPVLIGGAIGGVVGVVALITRGRGGALSSEGPGAATSGEATAIVSDAEARISERVSGEIDAALGAVDARSQATIDATDAAMASVAQGLQSQLAEERKAREASEESGKQLAQRITQLSDDLARLNTLVEWRTGAAGGGGGGLPPNWGGPPRVQDVRPF